MFYRLVFLSNKVIPLFFVFFILTLDIVKALCTYFLS